MSQRWQTPGLRATGEYQSAGYTFIVPTAASARTVTLKFVSRAITVIAFADGATITFTDEAGDPAGSAPISRVVKLTKGSHRFEVMCKGFAINATDMSVVVECTAIPVSSLETGVVSPDFTMLGTIA
tara:strand:- start:151 stop:531 length:381 start_codon:yes stop_codon:yes gene_type:complete